jgi:hypothetical protein
VFSNLPSEPQCVRVTWVMPEVSFFLSPLFPSRPVCPWPTNLCVCPASAVLDECLITPQRRDGRRDQGSGSNSRNSRAWPCSPVRSPDGGRVKQSASASTRGVWLPDRARRFRPTSFCVRPGRGGSDTGFSARVWGAAVPTRPFWLQNGVRRLRRGSFCVRLGRVGADAP